MPQNKLREVTATLVRGGYFAFVAKTTRISAITNKAIAICKKRFSIAPPPIRALWYSMYPKACGALVA